MAKIDRMMVGESLVGDGNEVAHIDLLIGPRGSPVETAFANALTNNKDGFTSLLAVVAPNLLTKPATVMFNKVTIKGAKQAVQMFGPAQRAVAMAVADCVEDGTIPAAEALARRERQEDPGVQLPGRQGVDQACRRRLADCG
jgi:5,6,7,8-tetrahydromethanopterin hydro-lyase